MKDPAVPCRPELGQRGKKPLSELVETMRDAIVLAPEQVELATSRPEDRTISVRLAKQGYSKSSFAKLTAAVL